MPKLSKKDNLIRKKPNTMKADVLLGLQWGDEGKGKIVDVLTSKYDIIARFQGGPNAGHTLELVISQTGEDYVPSPAAMGFVQLDFSDESVLTLPIVNRTSEHYFRASGHDYSGENGARSY